MRTIREPARDVPVVADVDVVVAGGGPSGFAAAVAAARRGAETLLIEGSGFLGGMFTGSQILTLCGYNCWIEPYERIVTGVGAEMIERAAELGGAEDNNSWVLNIDPEVVKLVLDDMVLGAGAQVLLHSWGVAPYIEGDAVQGMLIENKSGRGVVLAKVVIDATGDGDIAARAGADFRVGEMLQPMSQHAWNSASLCHRPFESDQRKAPEHVYARALLAKLACDVSALAVHLAKADVGLRIGLDQFTRHQLNALVLLSSQAVEFDRGP